MKPSLFASLSFEEARAVAEEQKKWLVVDFTAEWCAPCKNMDATTWRDPAVAQWFGAHAVAIQIDVDQDKTGERLQVKAMPTVVVFDGEKELDRSVGARSAPKLLEWLEGLRTGRTEVDSLREDAKTNLQARLHLSRVLEGQGRADEAAVEALWLWDHALEVDPAWVGVRLSYLIGQLKELAVSSTTARAELVKRRDAVANPAGEQISDFIALNEALDEPASTLAWFDRVKAQASVLGLFRQHGLRTLLQESERWADLGTIAHEPVKHLEEQFELVTETLSESPEGMPPEFIEETKKWMRDSFRNDAWMLVRALRAAGRAEDEAQVRARALELDPTDEMRASLADA